MMASSRSRIDSEGFQLVVRGGRPKQFAKSLTPAEYTGPPSKDVADTVRDTKANPPLVQFASLVYNELLQYIFCEDIVCYGIGCFGTCFIARQQFAFLLLIASAMRAKSVLVYDPRLSVQERTALEELGCVNIQHNELCRRQVHEDTLFYMPHCGRAMYNNLLWANWSPQSLSKVAIIGNSFQSYNERVPHQEMSETAPFILTMMEYCQEHPLPPYIEPTVFNDLCLHTFPLDKLLSAPSGTWSPCPPPPPHSSDPEIIANPMEQHILS